jgi:hypothetical protein
MTRVQSTFVDDLLRKVEHKGGPPIVDVNVPASPGGSSASIPVAAGKRRLLILKNDFVLGDEVSFVAVTVRELVTDVYTVYLAQGEGCAVPLGEDEDVILVDAQNAESGSMRVVVL